MPSERHIERQIQWRAELQKYGCNISLERTVRIRGAKVVVDVYAQVEGKTFLIEIGSIEDERKKALLQYYAQENPNIRFIHEDYGENKIQNVLESITSYRKTPEYRTLKERQRRIQQELEKERLLRQQELEKERKREKLKNDLIKGIALTIFIVFFGSLGFSLIFNFFFEWLVVVIFIFILIVIAALTSF